MNISQRAEQFALDEIKQYGTPPKILFELSNRKGQELSEEFGLDVELVFLGTCLMDVKLGEALSRGVQKEHVKMSIEATEEFLCKFDLDDDRKTKILNCIEAHHGEVSFLTKEAEVVANADCYRFIHPRGVLGFISALGERELTFEQILDYVERKLDEKKEILTLDICKEELLPYYEVFKKMIKEAKSS